MENDFSCTVTVSSVNQELLILKCSTLIGPLDVLLIHNLQSSPSNKEIQAVVEGFKPTPRERLEP